MTVTFPTKIRKVERPKNAYILNEEEFEFRIK